MKKFVKAVVALCVAGGAGYAAFKFIQKKKG